MQSTSSQRTSVRKVAWSSWIGSALEYYDFFLFSTAAALVIGPLFFPASKPELTTLAVLASVGAGYISRPFGAIVLGYLGDSYGRRFVLSTSLVVTGASTFIIGILPTYQEIGIAAPVLLVSLRLIQGFALSGEQPGAIALALELAEGNRRGFFTSFTLSGTQVGGILAILAFMPLSALLSEADFLAWGWRIPFLLSAILVAVGLWVRLLLPESPLFLSEKEEREVSLLLPLKVLWNEYKRDVLRIILSAQVAVTSTIVGVFSLSWAVGQMQIPRPTMLAVQLSSATVSMLVIPAWACLSDRVGRKPVFIFGALGSGVLIWPYFWALSQLNVPLAFVFGVLLSGVVYSAAMGVAPSLYSEMFSTKVRISGMALATQLGFTLAGQAPAIAASLTRKSPSEWTSVAFFVSICCAISAAAVFYTRETSRVHTKDLGKY